jgi:hypothetical protein
MSVCQQERHSGQCRKGGRKEGTWKFCQDVEMSEEMNWKHTADSQCAVLLLLMMMKQHSVDFVMNGNVKRNLPLCGMKTENIEPALFTAEWCWRVH